MAPPSPAAPSESPAPRRLLLIDFDWREADLMPELFRSSGVSVRLVAGEGPHDPGVRVAELCGLPRTLDLADLTREIFDLALVGERSSRRTQLETLLVALGTPSQTPEEFLQGSAGGEAARPGVDASLAMHAAALEQSLSGSTEALIDQAIPDLGEPTPLAPRLVETPAVPRLAVASLDDFPSPETRGELEDALKSLVSSTGAGTAQVHAVDRSRLRLVVQIGPEDRLLNGLIDLANDLGTPQVVTRLTDPGKGRTWAAWPFRTLQRRGVLAGASIDAGAGLASWQAMVEDVRVRWDREDHVRSAAAFPLTPQREQRWLDVVEFRERLDLAVARNGRDGLRFEAHRLEFPDSPEALPFLIDTLPGQLRDTDCLCQPYPHLIVLLAHGEPDGFEQLRRRMLTAWEEAWKRAGLAPPAAGFVDRRIALSGPEDEAAFRTAAEVWLVEP